MTDKMWQWWAGRRFCERIFSLGTEIDLLNFEHKSGAGRQEDVTAPYFDLYVNEPRAREKLDFHIISQRIFILFIYFFL